MGLPLIGIGKGVGLVGDGADIGADLLEGKKVDAAIKTGVAVGQYVIGEGAKKLPIKELGQQSIDTYFDKGTGAIRDGYFNNRVQKVEESDKLDLKIERKQ